MPTSVLIVEDEPEFMRRFTTILSDPALALAGSAGTARAAIGLLDVEPPDVVLLDLPDLDGVEVIRHAVRQRCGCDVLVVTMFDDDQHVLDSIEAGAAGYVLKDALPESIVSSIRDLELRRLSHQSGHRAAHPRPVPRLTGPRARGAFVHAVQGKRRPLLTDRETELLRLTAKGLSFETISELMGISPHTVVAHVRKIYRKLAVHSRGEAVYEATQLGLL